MAAELMPVDLKEAFQIQDALDERLDYELAGWKIGGTSRASMRSLGVDHPPFLGRLYREFTRDSPADFRGITTSSTPLCAAP